MANRKRDIQMKFWVTEEEKVLIEEKMKLLPTQRYGAYLRKMTIDGYIIYTDTADIRDQYVTALVRQLDLTAEQAETIFYLDALPSTRRSTVTAARTGKPAGI